MLERTDIFKNNLNNAIQSEFSKIIHNWSVEHPLINWGFSHPILTVILLLVLVSFVVFIIQNLFKFINQLITATWLAILGSPFKIGNYLFNFVKIRATQKQTRDRELSSVLETTKQELGLSEIVQRLETLNQEQDRLLKQVVEILNADRKPSSE
ncbi:hypothetical protein [Lusitaniella coriacea]|uniref:hypothetical protein n=1 Tax=Lusitaniella coriacea TaxID=1983105 RepID=UPI003CF97F2D